MSFTGQMGKQNVAYVFIQWNITQSYKGLKFQHISYKLDEPWEHIKWNKPHKKRTNIAWLHLHKVIQNNQDRTVVSRGGAWRNRESLFNEHRVLVWANKTFRRQVMTMFAMDGKTI